MSGLRLTVHEAAAEGRCHVETVRRAIRRYQDGKPGLKAKRRAGSGSQGPYLIERADFDAWIS